jgi:FkbM family methyltransferase
MRRREKIWSCQSGALIIAGPPGGSTMGRLNHLSFRLASFLQTLANRFGYRIEKLADEGDDRIDVFDLVINKLITEQPEVFFLQIGANDGVSGDPIRKYITQFHWRGILVEPLPKVFAKLIENYKSEPQLLFENAAIAKCDGVAKLYTTNEQGIGSCQATLNQDILRKRVGYRAPIQELTIPAMSIPTLISKHGIKRVDLAQIDTEGYDFEIIKLIDEAQLRPTVLHFEHVHLSGDERRQCFSFLRARGYRLIKERIDTVAYLSRDVPVQ